MLRQLCALVTASVLAVVSGGCGVFSSGPGPVIEVTASYPGATAEEIADRVAAPIEEQINGVEGMLDMESESRKDGTYRLRVRFKKKFDPEIAVELVSNRESLAEPVLPDVVKRLGVSVERVSPTAPTNEVSIVVEDRSNLDRLKLQVCATELRRHLDREEMLVKPGLFPGPDESWLVLCVNSLKCRAAEVKLANAQKAVNAAGEPQNLTALKDVTVTASTGEKIPLAELVDSLQVKGPPIVYRHNRYPAMRISGEPPDGRSPASATAAAVKRAETLVPISFHVGQRFAQ